MRMWKAGQVAGVNTPTYVRDNIHVDLLAETYCQYAEQLMKGTSRAVLHPSGYVESQGVFAERFAREMRVRFGLDCQLDLARQTEFPEPVMRVNTDTATLIVPSWDETTAWDAIAEYYL